MKEWYVNQLREGNSHKHFRNSSSLGAAKHRHDSYSDPTVQWVMTTKAMQGTAERATIHFSTSDEVYGDCKRWLEEIGDVTVFDMGLLTDALCECQLVVRMFDENRPSISDQIPIVRHWRQRLKYLYLDDPPGCMSSKYTYTKVALDFLEKGPYQIVIRGKIVKEYGGEGCLSVATKERSLARMVRYVNATDAVLAAEYPDFELVGAFYVFKLEGQICNGGRRNVYLEEDERFMAQCMQRLATAFNVHEADLRCQIEPLLALAKEYFKQGFPEEEAIIKAWRTRKKNEMPLDAVSKPLWRSLAWCITTSDIERHFALERRIFAHRGHCDNDTRFRLMRLGTEGPSTLGMEEVKWVIGRAQELWTQQHKGDTRKLRTSDARNGQKRKLNTDQQVSKAAWKRQRTTNINKEASASAPTSICPKFPEQCPGAGASTESFNNELHFNMEKYKKKKVEALRLGTLIASEKSPEFIDSAESDMIRQRKLDMGRLKKETRLAKRSKKFVMPMIDVMEKPIYVSTNVSAVESDNIEIKLASCNRVSNVVDACAVVSSTLVLNKMGDRLAAAVMLCGMIVVTPGFLIGNSKACLTCRAAIKTQRRLFLSEGFRTKYSGLTKVIVDAACKPTSKWKVMETLEQHKECCARASEKVKREYVVVTRHGEDIAGIGDHGGRQFTKEEFMKDVEKIDVDRTRGSV